MNELGEMLKGFRVPLGLSLNAAGTLSGCAQGSLIGKWESNIRTPRASKAIKYIAALGVKIDTKTKERIINLTDNKPKSKSTGKNKMAIGNRLRKTPRTSTLGKELTTLRENLNWNKNHACLMGKIKVWRLNNMETGAADPSDPEVIRYKAILKSGEAKEPFSTRHIRPDKDLITMPLFSDGEEIKCKHGDHPFKAELGGTCKTCYKHPDEPTFKEKVGVSYTGQSGVPKREYILTTR